MITVPVDKDALRRKSAPQLLCERARATPDAIAFHVVRGEQRIACNWGEYAGLVARTAQAFAVLDVTAGCRVAILAEASEEWIVCDLAAQAVGAIVYGIYPTSSASEVEYLLRQGAPVLVVAGSQDQADRILLAAARVPSLKHIVVIDEIALANRADPLLKSYASLVARTAQPGLAWLEQQAARILPDAPAVIVFTSGTTGNPKGALVTHGRHLAAAATLVDHWPMLAAREQSTVIYLPPCHVLGRNFAVTLPLISRLVPCFGDPKTPLPETCALVRPTVLVLVPRLLQKLAAQVMLREQALSFMERAAYRAAMRVARWHAISQDSADAPLAAFAYRICHAAVLVRILQVLGFDRLELVISGGAPVPPAAMTFWHLLGVNVVQGYGTTETAGALIAGQRGPFPRPGCVGTPPAGAHVRLDESGEILYRNADVFEGYWADDQATRMVKRDDGWLRTGDIGQWDGGELKLVDRARDFIVTAGGKTISPAFIENALRASPYVAEVIVFGHARKYITALIELDFDAAARWADAHGLKLAGPAELARSERIKALIADEIASANAQLARVEQVKAFRLLPKALQPGLEGEPVTATRKVRREQMYLRFKDLVEEMYDDSEERLIAAGIGASPRGEATRTAA